MIQSEPLTIAAAKVYRQAGITNPRRQVDVVEVQEPYTCFELSYYEGLGLCPSGGAAELVASGATQIDGDIPVNPSGGCMGANPIGATALIRLAEVAQQVRGKAGAYQIDGAKVGVSQAGGGWANLRGVAVVFYLGAITMALANIFQIYGLRKMSPSSAGTLALAEPLTATILGITLLNESLTTVSFIGLAIVSVALIWLSIGTKSEN